MVYAPKEGQDAARRDGRRATDVKRAGTGFIYDDPLNSTATGRVWVREDGQWRYDGAPDDRDLVGDWVEQEVLA